MVLHKTKSISMKIKNREISKLFFFLVYKYFAKHLPSNKWGRRVRYNVCKHIFKKCGKNVNIEKGANFGFGFDIEIGDNSGIGINAVVPSNTVIGNDVMMGPNCFILSINHETSRIDIPMRLQGNTLPKQTIIEDDVWIGRDVTMTPGRHISKGSIVAACCVLTKDFPEYSIIGGNPSKLIRSRK